MSIDVTNLEVVKTFSGFLQIMQEPDKYKDLLKETDRLINEQKKVLGLVKTKEQADAYLENAYAKIEKWTKDDQEKEKSFTEQVDNKNKELEDKYKQYQDLLNSASKKFQEAEETLKANTVVYEATLKSKKYTLDIQKQIETKLNEILVKEEELDSKLATVKKMLGE